MARIGSTVRRAVDKVGRVVGIFDKSLDSFTLNVEVSSGGDHGSRSEGDEGDEELHVGRGAWKENLVEEPLELK